MNLQTCPVSIISVNAFLTLSAHSEQNLCRLRWVLIVSLMAEKGMSTASSRHSLSMQSQVSSQLRTVIASLRIIIDIIVKVKFKADSHLVSSPWRSHRPPRVCFRPPLGLLSLNSSSSSLVRDGIW